jgi:hypothetical protein
LRKRTTAARQRDAHRALPERETTSRPWPLLYGGPLSRIAFVLIIIAFFALLAWVVLPPVMHFWSNYAEEIEENAKPR